MMKPDQKAINDVAAWCNLALGVAKQSGNMDTRPFVQNAELIVDALRAYASPQAAAGQESIAPVIGADAENGEGSVSFPPGWHEVDALTRADILKDVLHELEQSYRSAVSIMLPGHLVRLFK